VFDRLVVIGFDLKARGETKILVGFGACFASESLELEGLIEGLMHVVMLGVMG